MSEGLGRSPRSKRNSGEGASGRFRRLASSSEDVPKSSLSDTQPSQPVKIRGDGDTEPSRAVRISKDDASTVLPGADSADWTPAPPPLGHTPAGAPPAMDASGMPLPRRVTETDPEATQVTGAAYSPTGRGRRPKPTGPNKVKGGGFRERFNNLRARVSQMGCLPRLLIYGAFALILITVLGFAFVLYEYAAIASTLPSVEDLRERASQFETTRILDSK